MHAEWNRALGVEGQPYLRRWVLPIPVMGWSIRLHNWLSDDDREAVHDHPTWFWTLVLRGGYRDHYRAKHQDGWNPAHDQLTRGSLRFRAADHTHAVLGVLPHTWTLCLFGREDRRWSFFPKGRRPMRRDKYFAEIGHHLPSGGRVRMRPDGSLILKRVRLPPNYERCACGEASHRQEAACVHCGVPKAWAQGDLYA